MKSDHKDASKLQGEKEISQIPKYRGQVPEKHDKQDSHFADNTPKLFNKKAYDDRCEWKFGIHLKILIKTVDGDGYKTERQ